MKEILPPTECPSCNHKLIWKKDQLYCENQLCTAKGNKVIEHFAKTMQIKGLGPKTIEKIGLSGPWEVFELSSSEWIDMLDSQRLAEKIVSEIDNCLKTSGLQSFLASMSIPLMGKTASEKLCKRVSHINEINLETCKEAGLGPKVTENLLTWLASEEFRLYPESFYKAEKQQEKGPIAGVVCITGKLKSFKTKAEATKVLEGLGYKIKDSVTKDVTILVNESGTETAKDKKAKANNITIVTNLKTLIGD